MPKAKYKSHTRTKISSLPSIDDEDDVLLDLNLSNSIAEGSFLSSTASLSPDENDDDLPVGILKSNDKKRWKEGDVAWIKYRRSCFWPSYIKSVTGNKLSAYFISYHKFSEKEKSFRYSLPSKSIKKFHGKDYKKYIEEGRQYMTSLDLKHALIQEGCTVHQFNKAVELAEAYLLYRSNSEFSSKQEEIDFFRTKGVSHCLKSCPSDESDHSNLSGPPTPLDDRHSNLEQTQLADQSENQTFSTPQSGSNYNSLSASSEIITSTPTPAQNFNPNHDLTDSIRKARKRKHSSIDEFNRKCKKLVHYILSGECDQHLLDIYTLKYPSYRMNEYFKVWNKSSTSPKGKNMKTEEPYFTEESHLEEVAQYLHKFIASNLIDVNGIVRTDELLFSVFLPEITIFAIQKVFRKKVLPAVRIYNKGFTGKDPSIDPLLSQPLTEEERAKVERRNHELLKKIRLDSI